MTFCRTILLLAFAVWMQCAEAAVLSDRSSSTTLPTISQIGRNLGVQVRRAMMMRGDVGVDKDGKPVLYTVLLGAPAVLTVVDVMTAKVVAEYPLPKTSGAWGVKVSTDGSVYIGAYLEGLLYRFLPKTEELTNLGYPFASKDTVLYPMEATPDGKVYGGSYPSGHAYELDPASGKFRDLGDMTTNTVAERWIRVTVHDPATNKLYFGIGNQPQLVEYDLATGRKRDLLPAKYANITSVYDLNVEGGRLFCRKETHNPYEYFVIDTATGKEITVTNADDGSTSDVFISGSRALSPKSPESNKMYHVGIDRELYEYDLVTNTIRKAGVKFPGVITGYSWVKLDHSDYPGYSLVGSVGNFGALYRYNPQSGKYDVREVQYTGQPVNIHELAAGPDGRIYSGGYLAGNMGVYDPATDKTTHYYGSGQTEGLAFIGDKLFMGVYPNAGIYEYDTARQWNSSSIPKYDPAEVRNPDLLFRLEDTGIPGCSNQDRPFAMAGSEKLQKLFVGTVPKNAQLGGVLATYDLKTRQPQVHCNIVPDQSIVALACSDGFAYGGTSVFGGMGAKPRAKEARLFEWDVQQARIVFSTVPAPGKPAVNRLLVAPDGNIWGMAGGTLFVFDPVKREITHRKDELPNAASRYAEACLLVGKDGNIYGTAGGTLFRVNPQTKEFTPLATGAREMTRDNEGRLYITSDPITELYQLSPESLGTSASVSAKPSRSEFFVLWGETGEWNGRLKINGGHFTQITPYIFADEDDAIRQSDGQQISWHTRTNGGVDGLHLLAEAKSEFQVSFESDRVNQEFSLKDLPKEGFKTIRVGKTSRDYLIIGRGNPEKGPRSRNIPIHLGLPDIPSGEKIARIPDSLSSGSKIRIELQKPPLDLKVRRRSQSDGTLYMELYSGTRPLSGHATVSFGAGKKIELTAVGGSLWLAIEPFIGILNLEVSGQPLRVPCTLVETRGPRLFLNGEPFLIKGTLPRGLNDKDAHYLKTLGINTIRGFVVDDADRYGFMLLASLNSGIGPKIVRLETSPTPESFDRNLPKYVNTIAENAAVAAQSPYTLILQLGNEQTDAGDPWSELRQRVNTLDRLDKLLIETYAAAKPIDPMLPLGYANHARGYIAPDFLDVYMHNSYMNEDRYHIPLSTFMRWQGCDRRPFVNSEFGANRYTPQAYHGAGNTPVLEKLHAWNFPNRWEEYVAAGTAGAVNYCTYDLDAPRDQGNSNFGILTYDRQPKLACWEVGHMWRDFDVSVDNPGNAKHTSASSLRIAYKRDYWARDCKLQLVSENASSTIALADFPPHEYRVVPVPIASDSFRWEMNYTTHRGLPMLATGAFPVGREKEDFLQLLKGRDTFSFLSQLLDAEVLRADGKPAAPTLTQMQREDGVVPVAFRKPDGTVYVTALARLPVQGDGYIQADIQTSFRGKAVLVDEWTAEPTNSTFEWENRPEGVLFRNVNVPCIPGAIGQRSEKPLAMPVFRIKPSEIK